MTVRSMRRRRRSTPREFGGLIGASNGSYLWIALGVYYILPFIRWNRGPNEPSQAVLVDMAHSRFYFFFIELWPQEVYYFTGLLILAALTLFLSNALFGRVWCGYACPQTVWTDLFLFVERRIEGDRRDRIKLDQAPWDKDKIMKRVAKHAAWLVIALFTGGAAVLYFQDAPTLVWQLLTFSAPFVAYLWMGVLTFTTYSLAGHMREQVCLYMCPWPRIQAALTDTDALNVTYRSDRGEPRMSVKDAARAHAHGEPAGDCIDCMQCVAVCPTGVDIRHGSQLGCIQCGLCIDACDAVMAKVHRPTRLIAYDTDENLARRKRGERNVYRLVRPRTILYAALIAVTGCVMLYALISRSSMNMSVLHVRAPLFTQTVEGGVRNGYTLRFSNKVGEARDFTLEVAGLKGAEMTSVVAKPLGDGKLTVHVDPDATLETPVCVATPADVTPGKSTPITFTATDALTGERKSVVDHFFARERTMSGPLTGWRVLAILVSFFLVIFIANGALAYFALHTLHGSELENPYDASQGYNAEIAEARAQAERGWTADVTTRAAGQGERIVVEFRNRDGAPISDLAVTARLMHPFDAALDRVATLATDGKDYAGVATPVQPGRWTLVIEAKRGSERMFRSENKFVVADTAADAERQ